MIDAPTPDAPDVRLRDALARLLGRPLDGDASGADALDQALIGARALAEEVVRMRAFGAATAERIEELSRAARALAALDFRETARVGDEDDIFDGFAVGLNALASELSAATVSKEYANNIIESMTDGLLAVGPDGRLRAANRAARDLFLRAAAGEVRGEGEAPGARVFDGQPLERLLPGLSVAEILRAGGVSDLEMRLAASDGGDVVLRVSASVLRGRRGDVAGIVVVARDETEHRRRDEEREQLREAIRRKAALVDELSAPLLPVATGVIVVPLIGALDDQRSACLTEAILRGIAELQAKVVVLDITGLAVASAASIDGLPRVARAARLLGAEVVLTGARPDAAAALIEMDVDLSGITAFGALDVGLRYARGRASFR